MGIWVRGGWPLMTTITFLRNQPIFHILLLVTIASCRDQQNVRHLGSVERHAKAELHLLTEEGIKSAAVDEHTWIRSQTGSSWSRYMVAANYFM